MSIEKQICMATLRMKGRLFHGFSYATWHDRHNIKPLRTKARKNSKAQLRGKRKQSKALEVKTEHGKGSNLRYER
jgi:hypothetical protein